MKTRLIKILLTLALAVMVLPVMSQDYMNIYFKNGDFRKFYMKNITEIVASKVDTEGVQHSDFSSQCITTIYDTYVYNIEDVDSITFTKIDEEKAEENFVSAMPEVFSAIDECETIEDVEDKIEDIKNTEGIADAWSDGHQLYVSIAEGETFKFHFNHNIEAEDDTVENDVAQVRAILSDISKAIKTEGSPLKVLIANQQYKDRSRDYSDFFDPLISDFAKCGITVKLLNGPTVGNSPTADFFYDNSDDPENPHFFDYDVILLSTHGGYCPHVKNINGEISYTRNLHGFITSDEILIVDKKPQNGWWKDKYNQFKDWRDHSAFKDVTDEQINFTFVEERRKNIWGFNESFWVFYPELTESFFSDIAVGKFHNPKSLLFNAACESLKGEGEERYSFAEAFFEHDLGVYLGYTESDFFGQRTGANFLTKVLLNHSLEKAYWELPAYQRKESYNNIMNSDLPWYIRWNADPKNPAAQLLFRVNPKYEDETQQWFLFPTITKEIDQEVALQTYNYSNVVEVCGYATATSADSEDMSMGFFYSQDEDMASPIKVSNVEVFELSFPIKNGNILFRADLTALERDQTYYYCAYTYDGKYYNYGDTCSFIITQLQVSTNHLSMETGWTRTVDIVSGHGGYEVNSDNETVATAYVNENTISINALSAGEATITVKDKIGQTVTIVVSVSEKTDIPVNTACPDSHHPHMIDLGLPSGTKWACCNVEATTPEAFGDYYAWGETESKNIFSWKNYRYSRGTANTLTKYCTKSSYGYNGFTDNLVELQSGDDPASTLYGDSYCLPSKEDWNELITKCTWTWIDNGVLVRGPSGSLIYLPAAGYRSGVNLYDADTEGYYWSSTLDKNSPDDAWFLYFGDKSQSSYDYYRCYGRSIRPVLRKKNQVDSSRNVQTESTDSDMAPTVEKQFDGMVVRSMSRSVVAK